MAQNKKKTTGRKISAILMARNRKKTSDSEKKRH